jgi:hypothetical protein
MRLALVLAALVAAAVPALMLAGTTALHGLGWLIVVAGLAVVLIDLSDRITEWLERRRWGRLARRPPGAERPDDPTAPTRPERRPAPRRSG